MAGREFILTTYRQNWQENRVYFYNDQGDLDSILAQWTSVFPEDPLVCLSSDKSLFRAPDLLELADFIQGVYLASNAEPLAEGED